MSIPRIDLRPGYSISRLLKGHWQLSRGHSASVLDRRAALHDMRNFYEAGITSFDVADIYTGAEELIGDFIREYRLPIQMHTKYVPDLHALSHVSLADTVRIVERSLARLNVERLDLVQFHWWDYSVPRYVEVAHHLKTLQAQGKIRHIGVTNFDLPRLRELTESGVDIVSAQVQYSVLDRRPAGEFAKACADLNIALLCYGTLAGGYLSERSLGAVDTTPENRSLTKYRLIIDEVGGWDAYQARLRCLQDIAKSHGADISDIAMAYTLAQENVAGCIIGARHSAHAGRLVQAAKICLSPADLECIEAFPAVTGDVYGLERNSDRHREIMKYNNNAQQKDDG